MNQHLRNTIDHLHEGVQVIGHDWRYVYLNATACRQGRRPVEELMGRRIHDCYPGIEQTEMFAALSRVMVGRAPEVFRNRFEYPDRSHRWFDLRIDPVPSGICIVSMDVTEEQEVRERLHAVEAQLQQAQRLESIGRLAGGVAHDFNNQLTVILGLAHFILEDESVPEPVRRDVREIEAAAARSVTMTRQLLAFSRRQVMHVERLLLPDVVGRVTRMLERLLNADVRLDIRAASDVEWIMADSGQLENVITNLAVNASDAMPNGGRLTIATDTAQFSEADAKQYASMLPGRYAVLSVTDTGTGMDETTKAQCFEPFFTTKEPGRGTGLGLSTVYGVVKQMGGFIWVYSEVGQGTTFRLYFPVAAASEPGAPAPQKEIKTLATDTILVVEDDAALRNFVVRALESAGYQVTACGTAEEAEHLVGAQGGAVRADSVRCRAAWKERAPLCR